MPMFQGAGMKEGGVPHKGLKLPKRFTNLPFDFSGYQGEKGRACIQRKKNTQDPIRILYFLHTKIWGFVHPLHPC